MQNLEISSSSLIFDYYNFAWPSLNSNELNRLFYGHYFLIRFLHLQLQRYQPRWWELSLEEKIDKQFYHYTVLCHIIIFINFRRIKKMTCFISQKLLQVNIVNSTIETSVKNAIRLNKKVSKNNFIVTQCYSSLWSRYI